MKITHAQYSHAGGRQVNQDAMGHSARRGRTCFLVSDGIAGRPGGAIASQLAISAALATSDAATESDDLLQTCIAAANRTILAEQQRGPLLREMAATIVALLIDSDACTAKWAHVGDSRLYRFHRGRLIERTRDHSLVQQLADAGLPFDGVNPSLLLQALGMSGEVRPQVSSTMPIVDGDAFLLCTDGFWQALPDEVIGYCLRMAHTVDDWVTLLVEAARQRFEIAERADNYSALAVWVGSPESVTLLEEITLPFEQKPGLLR